MDMDDFLDRSDEDAVKAEYLTLGYLRDKEEVGTLHMFFSPHRIPRGMTLEEIRTCLNLYPLRKLQKVTHARKHDSWITQAELRKTLLKVRLVLSDLYEGKKVPDNIDKLVEKFDGSLPPEPDVAMQIPTSFPPALPDDLLRGPMNRERFNVGIRKFADEAVVFISQNKQLADTGRG